MTEDEIYFGTLWDTLDFLAEHPFAPAQQVVVGMKDLIERDPEGAARRASGQPQYDKERFALAAPSALADCE